MSETTPPADPSSSGEIPSGGRAFDGREFVRRLSSGPGVYRMVAGDGSALYVGKAASLKKRVANYFSRTLADPRLRSMVSQVASMEVTLTRTAAEALVLENQLIKSLKPRYNVLLRDDKSYPYIRLSRDDWPRVAFYRGSRDTQGRLFGPFPSAYAVRETLSLLHKLFRLRSCEDSVFRNRSRPCLQYQIGRCSAPCVGLVEPAEYAAALRRAELFLDGRSHELAAELEQSMTTAASELRFEDAARLRDTIGNLRRVQARQFVEGGQAELDVIACAVQGGSACVLVLSFRNGMNFGTRSYFPRVAGESDPGAILSAFVTQHYLDYPPPTEIVLGQSIDDAALIEEVLGAIAGRRVQIKTSVRGERARFLELAQRNAQSALESELDSSAAQQRRRQALATLLELPTLPQRMECFDISHTQGEATVASCVVFGPDGAQRSQYRRFNIAGITGGDDYAAMRQALERRFRRGLAEGVLPDLLFIDGGKGQLAQAVEVLNTLEIELPVIGIAKGEARRPGEETLLRPDGTELHPGPESPALHLIQQIRDEAHRFAISGHRGRRAKTRERSPLEDVEGIGPARRTRLLRHFGGMIGLKGAGVEEIARVEGINAELARRVYAALHGGGNARA
jgi:excinuclease ABC subunit C